MWRRRRTNPRHAPLWFPIDGLSYSESALFYVITGPVIPTRMYVLPPAPSLSRRFDGGVSHMYVKVNAAVPLQPLCLPCVSAVTLEERRAEDASPLWMLPDCMSVCLCGHVERSEGNRVVQVGGRVGGGVGGAVRRTRRAANLPGHLARLMLFKQVPRRLVSCLVKWLTFWFNQHPRLPDELDHYQKCTGSAMSLTCQNQTRLLIYLLHSPWEEHCSAVWA